MELNSSEDVHGDHDRLAGFENRLSGMESLLAEIRGLLSVRPATKEWYTVREVAEILNRSES